MSFYDVAKQAVPLSWRIAAHRGLDRLRDQGTRLGDRRAVIANQIRRRPLLPPGELIYLVAAHQHPSWFLRGGRSASQAILESLERHDVELEQLSPVLDFGSGVGRIIRHFAPYKVDLYGTDYNPILVKWCQENLDVANFGINTLEAKLTYPDNFFGLIYSFSVFTHLTERLQEEWMEELTRVLRPGGYLYFTTHGEFYLAQLSEQARQDMRAGKLVVTTADRAGENICSAFHPEAYVRRLVKPLEVVEFRARGARGDSDQDAWLLRKPTDV